VTYPANQNDHTPPDSQPYLNASFCSAAWKLFLFHQRELNTAVGGSYNLAVGESGQRLTDYNSQMHVPFGKASMPAATRLLL
jgi:hypothetical protein